MQRFIGMLYNMYMIDFIGGPCSQPSLFLAPNANVRGIFNLFVRTYQLWCTTFIPLTQLLE